MEKKYRRTDRFILEVVCAVCGKHGQLIRTRDGTFVDNNLRKGGWSYWGKIQLNTERAEPYFYQWGVGGGRSLRLKNPKYTPRTPRLFADYFECPRCTKKADARIKKRDREAQRKSRGRRLVRLENVLAEIPAAPKGFAVKSVREDRESH